MMDACPAGERRGGEERAALGAALWVRLSGAGGPGLGPRVSVRGGIGGGGDNGALSGAHPPTHRGRHSHSHCHLSVWVPELPPGRRRGVGWGEEESGWSGGGGCAPHGVSKTQRITLLPEAGMSGKDPVTN